MNKPVRILLICIAISCQSPQDQPPEYEFITAAEAIALCGPTYPEGLRSSLSPFLDDEIPEPVVINDWRYLPAGKISGLPMILANDNLKPAGNLNEGVLQLDLEVKWGDFRMETNDRPGLRLIAAGEKDGLLSIPSPLVRVKEGTLIKARVFNTLEDSTISVFGLQERPSTTTDSLFILPGESGEVTFMAGKPGTYMYWIKLGKGVKKRFGPEREQLAGAFIVDPEEGSVDDRVFVMNIWSNPLHSEEDRFLESLTINGRSWPHTEMLRPNLGETVRWRIINASNRNHPMHLHGFYFNVLEKGAVLTSEQYGEDEALKVVTDFMTGKKTMVMEWEASRPGRWLFHCHLSFHVSSMLRLPGAEALDPPGSHQHMAGLVLGIEVPAGPTDLISKGDDKKITLHANEFIKDSVEYAAFEYEEGECNPEFKPGPMLVLKQYQPTYVTVQNNMTSATSVHWHGLEIDSWSDGVPEWSSSDGLTSPIIEPSESFEYKLTLMRPGTFVYHSHLDDINQITKGLYGALIVMEEGQEYDPRFDHIYMQGWRSPEPRSLDDLDLNGWDEIPIQAAKVGESHRIRLINIAPAGQASVEMLKDSVSYPLIFYAKDGATIREDQQRLLERSPRFGVGETADFIFEPKEPGTYYLDFRMWQQKWVVTDN